MWARTAGTEAAAVAAAVGVGAGAHLWAMKTRFPTRAHLR